MKVPTRGPKRMSTGTLRVLSELGNGRVKREWALSLECGHIVMRPSKVRRSHLGKPSEDDMPKWAYCEDCLKEQKPTGAG